METSPQQPAVEKDSSEVPVVSETPQVQSDTERAAAALETVRRIQESFPRTKISKARGWS